MAFSTEEQQQIGEIVEGVVERTVEKTVEAKIEPLRAEIRTMAVKHEVFEHDIRGMFKDIKSYMDDNAGLRDRVDQHDVDIAVLNRTVLGRRQH